MLVALPRYRWPDSAGAHELGAGAGRHASAPLARTLGRWSASGRRPVDFDLATSLVGGLATEKAVPFAPAVGRRQVDCGEYFDLGTA